MDEKPQQRAAEETITDQSIEASSTAASDLASNFANDANGVKSVNNKMTVE